jgi:nickel-dependent lactate racemase
MRIGMPVGDELLGLEVDERSMVGVERAPVAPDLPDAAAAVRDALEAPVGFPALRRALTPDDHVAIVVDERLPQLGALLTAVLEHVTGAHVHPEAITLVCPPPDSGQPWRDELPEVFQEVRAEVHDPAERKRLSYLASTRRGKRIYLNRTVVDADQAVLLTGRGYDALLGYAGAAGALYPALSDEANRADARARLSMRPPGGLAWPLQQEAAEVAWLLGAPFFVQVIAGTGDGVAHVLGGLAESGSEGERLLDARWRVRVDRPADVVVAGLAADPARQDFAALAHALACASRVVKRDGRIVLLAAGTPELGEAAAAVRQAEDPTAALRAVRDLTRAADQEAAFQWASAAEQARIYLLSGLPAETAEELFTVPLDHAGQVQRLLADGASCVLLPEADRSLAVLQGP